MISRLNPLGRQVRRIIDRSGLTYTQFSEVTGIPYNWIHGIMNSREEPRWAMFLRKIKRATGCSYDELLRM